MACTSAPAGLLAAGRWACHATCCRIASPECVRTRSWAIHRVTALRNQKCKKSIIITGAGGLLGWGGGGRQRGWWAGAWHGGHGGWMMFFWVSFL